MSSASSIEAGGRRPRFSVVIVTYNSRDNIQACLDSLDRNGGPDYEIIVVDNNSRDATPEYLKGRANRSGIDLKGNGVLRGTGGLQALLNRENLGFSKACNQGAARARGEFLIFLNPDTLTTRGWAETMAGHFADPQVGAVGPLSNYVAGRQRLDLHLPPGFDLSRFAAGSAVEAAESLARTLAAANGGRGAATKLLIGFCLMIRRALFDSLGGMDEKLFLGNDDLDLSWRLRNRGHKLLAATDAFVFHEGQKSFQTESKPVVDRLVQESTDALYLKLVDHYGGAAKVPSPLELWDMNWFNPSPALRDSALRESSPRQNTEASLGSETQPSAWSGICAVIYRGPRTDMDAAARTLGSLPARRSPADPEAILLNCAAGWEGAAPAARKLDLGPSVPARTVLEIAHSLASGSHLLFCAAGVELPALFNHWLDKRDLREMPTVLPLPVREDDDLMEDCAFLCAKSWLAQAAAGLPGAAAAGGSPDPFAALQTLLRRAASDTAGRWDAPALFSPGLPRLPAGSLSGWTPVKPAHADGIALYPESLRPAMRAARDIAFAGSAAEAPARQGAVRVFNLKGELVPLRDQDLVILRVSPDLLDGLPERMANLRRQAPSLEKLMVVLNSAQALQPAGGERPPLAAVDVTPEGVRAALWRAGYAVAGETPYSGFPADADADMGSWTQIEARPRTAAYHEGKLVSIIILGFNQVEYTKKCIESIRRHTRQRYELILVDNGSHDGTEDFFRSLPGAKVVRNAENLGVAKGWNQGMRLAEGEYLLILNNDTIVGPDWLENMVRLAESDPAGNAGGGIGMVGPRSNYIAGPQLVSPVAYRNETEIQEFIRTWQKGHELSADEFGFIKGFCLLIPRAVFAKVGFFDERYGKGNFEDDDYALRVRYHGYRNLMAHDSFIHHFGSVSFNQASVDWMALMKENEKKYREKWSKGPSAIHDTQVSDPGAPVRPQAPAAPAREVELARMAYAAGDIAGARRLFLEAQAHHPRDPEAYCGLGVILFHDAIQGRPEAYHEAFTLLTQALELNPDHADAAQNLIDTLHASETGNLEDADWRLPAAELQTLCDRFPGNPVFSRLRAEAPSPRPAPVSGAPTPASGAAVPPPVPALAAWKGAVEDLISRKDYLGAVTRVETEMRAGGDPGACYNYLGIIAHALGDFAFAVEHFTNALEQGSGASDGGLADVLYNLVDTLVSLGRPGEAADLLEHPPEAAVPAGEEAGFAASAEQIRHAAENGGTDPRRVIASRDRNVQGEKLLREGGQEKASGIFESLLRDDPADFRALNNLGLAEWYAGRGEAAWDYFRKALGIRPAWTDALINAFDAALALGRVEDFRPLLEKALAARPGHAEALRMRRYLEKEGGAIYASLCFEVLEAEARILDKAETDLREGRQSEAITAFADSVQRRPQNPQALCGLGIIAFTNRKYADAYALFEAALALNPLDQDLLVNLWQTAQALSKEGEVLPRLRESLEKNPWLDDVRAIVKEYA